MFGYDIADILMNIPITLLALTFHEYAHGWVSTKLGDPTPRYQGRLTFNPFAHLDLVGTLLMILTGFGWARPVQVNPRFYKNAKRGMALVSIAGPLSNFLLAIIGAALFGIFAAISFSVNINGNILSVVSTFFVTFIIRNIGLMVFNLIPIPPLDGSKVLGMFLPNRLYYKLLQYERYSIIIIMLLSFTGVLDSILGFGINAVYNLITTPVQMLLNLLYLS